MPRVCGSWFIVRSRKRRSGFSLKRELIKSKTLRGFSLIELLIVISLFGFTSTLITIGYNGFSRRQLLTNAVSSFKTNLRFTQSQAATGVKDYNACSPLYISGGPVILQSVLKGWYIEINLVSSSGASSINNSYNIKSVCTYTVPASPPGGSKTPCSPSSNQPQGTYECIALWKTVTLPDNVQIGTFNGAAISGNVSKYIFFEPLKAEPTFFSTGSQITQFYNTPLSPDPTVIPSFLNTPCCGVGTSPSGMKFGFFEKSDPGVYKNVTISATGGVQ